MIREFQRLPEGRALACILRPCDGPPRTLRPLSPGGARWWPSPRCVVAAAALPAPAAAAPWTGRTFPDRYDLRKLGRVSHVGQQNHHGTCWIFAAIGSLESALLPGTRLDLSENHMADFQGSRLRFEGRAPSTISTAYVARWEGPVLERDDPYPHPGASREGLPAVRHVQEVLFLPPHGSPLANSAIKWAVMKYGAVDATMAYEH